MFAVHVDGVVGHVVSFEFGALSHACEVPLASGVVVDELDRE